MAGNHTGNTVMETRCMSPHHSPARLGYFLNPSAPNNAPLPDLPPRAFTYNLDNSAAISLNVDFKGWQKTYRPWDEWVLHMEPRFGSIWKDLGIFDAIKNSTLRIVQDKDIVLALARKWFSETSTFVFKWGEACVTLEDICVLGGYPVNGNSIFLAPGSITNEMAAVDRRLTEARRVIRSSGVKKVPLNRWIDLFRGNVNGFEDLEHVGFLVFWLSKYVFPKASESNVVGKHVHYIAIRLAMGFKIALAPAVLASIYRDLTTIESRISATISWTLEVTEVTEIWGPMQLVQIWAWERFAALKPVANPIVRGQHMMARWDGCRRQMYTSIMNVDTVIENHPIGFSWRPYVGIRENHAIIRNLYTDREQWIEYRSDLLTRQFGPDVESFVKFVRPSELVGIDCIVQYLPHRVAQQFGFDQDLPGPVGRCNQNYESAWANYCRPVEDMMLYFPSRFVKTNVTSRYLQWWDWSKHVMENWDIALKT